MGELAGLIAAFTWSVTSIALTSLSARTSPVALSALRLSAATLALPFVVLFSGTTGEIAAAPIIGLLAVAGSGFLGYGIGDTAYIRALSVVGIQITFPIATALFICFTVLGGILFFGESVTFGIIAGAILVGGGSSLLISSPRGKVGASVADRAEVRKRRLIGFGLLMTVGITWAIATLWLSEAKGDLSAIAAGAIRTPAGAIGLLAFGLATRPRDIAAPFSDRRHIGAIVLAGLFGTLFGSLLYVYSVVEAGPAKAAVLSSTAPLMALPLGVVFLGEVFTKRSVWGTVCCVGGIVLVTL